jgi:hypothetical protein
VDLEKQINILASLWPILLSLLGLLVHMISLQFRVRRLEEKNGERDDTDQDKIDRLAKIGEDVAVIMQGQAVLAAEIRFLTGSRDRDSRGR